MARGSPDGRRWVYSWHVVEIEVGGLEAQDQVLDVGEHLPAYGRSPQVAACCVHAGGKTNTSLYLYFPHHFATASRTLP